jgi:hypothetical protein
MGKMTRPHIDSLKPYLRHCLGQAVPVSDHVLEFGVYSGMSINIIAGTTKGWPVHGFDSFDGLPEPWHRAEGDTYEAGHFARPAPEVLDNVRLHVGWIEDTLPRWLLLHPGPVSFVHVDVDLYSSTKTILDGLNDRIVPGTVICFDELWGYENFRQGEWRAFREWVRDHHRKIEFIATSWEQRAAVRVLR